MDEMKITSRFMTNLISKAIKMVLRKKLGYSIDIQLNEVRANTDSEKIKVHLNVDAELTKDELTKILDSIGSN